MWSAVPSNLFGRFCLIVLHRAVLRRTVNRRSVLRHSVLYPAIVLRDTDHLIVPDWTELIKLCFSFEFQSLKNIFISHPFLCSSIRADIDDRLFCSPPKDDYEPDEFFSIRKNEVVSVSEDNNHRQDPGPGLVWELFDFQISQFIWFWMILVDDSYKSYTKRLLFSFLVFISIFSLVFSSVIKF